MSEASWICQNPECGLMFQWNRQIETASYIKNGEPVDKRVPGFTRPDGCPECGGDEVDSLEG